ncbi:hypothetical protein GOX01_20770 [Gluconobacter oxydans]|nr:hypothetical protein GOX01_20770 [Gluconobacter oxydans]
MSTECSGTGHFHITGEAERMRKRFRDDFFLLETQGERFIISCKPERESRRGDGNPGEQGLQDALPVALVKRIGTRCPDYRPQSSVPAENDQKRFGPPAIYRRDTGRGCGRL